MGELDRPIGRVFRRLRTQRFLAAVVWALLGWLAVATVVMGVDRFARPVPGPDWLPFAVGAGLALATALVVAITSGPSRVEAAVAIDRAFGLNERLSTTLTLPADLRETPAGRALVADTIRHVSGLDVADRFGLKLPRRAWAPLIPALIAAAFLFAPAWTQRIVKATSADPEAKLDRKLMTKQSELLKDRIAAQRKEMDKSKFAEAEKLLAEVEKAASDLAKSPPAEKDKALVAINKLSEALKERQKSLGSPEQINRQMQQLKEMTSSGPAGEFMKDLAKGDFEKAAKDLNTLKEKLASGKLNEQEKKAIKDQIAQMSKSLKEAANLDKRKEQLEQARKNGGMTEEQFKQEMAKLDEKKKGLEGLQKMAEQLAKAQNEMNKGDLEKAAAALGMGQKQLEELAQQMAEMQSLDAALADLQDAKDGMNGADQMNGFGDALGQFGNGRERRNNNGGLGRGKGAGDRPEAKDDTANYSTKVKGVMQKGKAIFEGSAPPSTQVKGESKFAIQGEAATASGNAADALSGQKIPKSVERHVRSYIDQINKGQ